MRVLVCGGRDFIDRKVIFRVLDRIHETETITTVIQGYARGVDRLAHEWALKRKVSSTGSQFQVSPEEWDKLGKGAGHMRNRRMLLEGKPEIVVAFPGGRGTANMVSQSRAARVEVIMINREGVLV